VAHEWAHNVHGPGEAGLGLAGYSKVMGARPSAAVALALYLAAALGGGGAWLALGRPPAFGLLLLLTSLYVGWLGSKLIREPVYARAKPFYVSGFAFFLLPLAGLLVDRWLGKLS